jgi:choice-of-anchor C domain-containing protein
MRLILTVAAALLTATAANAVTLVNGSFEDGTAIAPGGFVTLETGDTTSITGWTVLSDGIDYIGTYWQASEGSRSLDLSALTSGGILQSVSGFEVGKRYRITFDLSGNPDGGDNPKRMTMSATGGVAATYVYTLTDNTRADMNWTTLTYEFIASGIEQDIQFRSLELNPSGTALDNVSISLVPEPTTWALLIAGFAMTGVAMRRRQAGQVATN